MYYLLYSCILKNVPSSVRPVYQYKNVTYMLLNRVSVQFPSVLEKGLVFVCLGQFFMMLSGGMPPLIFSLHLQVRSTML